MLRHPLYILSLWVLLFLTGCQATTSTSVATPTPTIISISTATMVQSSSTPIAPPEPTEQNSPTPLPTELPDLAATLVATVPPRTFDTYPSPDGMHTAAVVRYECTDIGGEGNENAYETLALTNSSDTTVIAEQLLNCGGLGASGLEGRFWSSDSRYFYYTDAREGVPEGCGVWERPITRYDLTTQETVRLGGGPASPDGTQYVTFDDENFLIWSVDEGVQAMYSPYVPNTHVGQIMWSPDGEQVAYLLTSYYCTEPGTTWLVLLDLVNDSQTLLLETEEYNFGFGEWKEPNTIRLRDYDNSVWLFELLNSPSQ